MAFMATISSSKLCTYSHNLHDNGLGGFSFSFQLEDLLEWWWRKIITVVILYFKRWTWQLWGASGFIHPTRYFLLQVLLFGWRCRRLSNYDYPYGLSHTSCFHSMRPYFGDGTSLAGSLRERSGALLQTLRENVCGGHEFFEENVVWTWKSWFWRKRYEVEIVPPSVPKFVITKFWTNEICIAFQRIWVQSLIFVTNEQM